MHTLRANAIAPGGNVFAELGSTWFLAAAGRGRRLTSSASCSCAVGEDNILWGTDSIWYGPTQQLIDAFRAFQIPPRCRTSSAIPR